MRGRSAKKGLCIFLGSARPTLMTVAAYVRVSSKAQDLATQTDASRTSTR
jgi:hypothetical protein